jgi:hypothetical protein
VVGGLPPERRALSRVEWAIRGVDLARLWPLSAPGAEYLVGRGGDGRAASPPLGGISPNVRLKRKPPQLTPHRAEVSDRMRGPKPARFHRSRQPRRVLPWVAGRLLSSSGLLVSARGIAPRPTRYAPAITQAADSSLRLRAPFTLRSPEQFTQPMHPTQSMQRTQPIQATHRVQAMHATHATHSRIRRHTTVNRLPTTPALPAVPAEPATATLPAVATDPATATLPAVATDPATATLPAVATDPATAMLPVVATEPATATLSMVAIEPTLEPLSRATAESL